MKSSNQLSFSLPQQDYCKTRQDTNIYTTKQNLTNSGSHNKQQNRHIRIDNSLGHGAGVKYLTSHIITLNFVLVQTPSLISLHGGYLPYAMYHNRENQIKNVINKERSS